LSKDLDIKILEVKNLELVAAGFDQYDIAIGMISQLACG
jgi:hypothetical protein